MGPRNVFLKTNTLHIWYCLQFFSLSSLLVSLSDICCPSTVLSTISSNSSLLKTRVPSGRTRKDTGAKQGMPRLADSCGHIPSLSSVVAWLWVSHLPVRGKGEWKGKGKRKGRDREEKEGMRSIHRLHLDYILQYQQVWKKNNCHKLKVFKEKRIIGFNWHFIFYMKELGFLAL